MLIVRSPFFLFGRRRPRVVALAKQAVADRADNPVQTDSDEIMNGLAGGSVPGRKGRAITEGITLRKGDVDHGLQHCES